MGSLIFHRHNLVLKFLKLSVPKLLYRGDADRNRIRDLKDTLHLYQLQTNLLKGGQGHLIFDTPVIDLVGQHIDPGWASTHFLSFSEDKTTALRFGMDCEPDEVESRLENFIADYGDEKNWSFAVITIDTTTITWNKMGRGLYYGSYVPGLKKFVTFPGQANVILIDVREALQAYPGYSNYEKVMLNAVRDKEWLLLPATATILNNKKIEFSGIMDGQCIAEIERYKQVR